VKKILIADDISLEGLQHLRSDKYHVKCRFGISNKELVEKFGKYDVLVIRSIRNLDKEFLAKVSIKVIATCSKGTDHIDTEYAKSKSIKIINADDSNNISAAEHTLGLILSIFKNIKHSDNLVRSGNFADYDFKRIELFGKKVGIIGFGKVGSYVGKLCNAFGMKIFANDTDEKVIRKFPDYKFRDLNFVLRNSDIVTIHIPLNKDNVNFISGSRLELLKTGSVLINTSRGKVIDENYLYGMLKRNRIYFAGLDVMQNEPTVNEKFFKLKNVLLTNHIAGKTEESRKRISENIFKKIDKIFRRKSN